MYKDICDDEGNMKYRVNFRAVWFIMIALSAFRAEAVSPEAIAFPTYPNVPYAFIEGAPLLMDIYVPNGDGPYPVVLYIHGGGWVSGDKGEWDEGFIDYLFQSGIAFASMEYRLTADSRFSERTFPAQIQDVKGAIRYLRASAGSYKLDPDRIITWGSSAGGHLSALAGTSGGVAELEGAVGGNLDRSSNVLGAVDYSGPSCMETFAASDPWVATPDGPLSLLFGHDFGDIMGHWEDDSDPYPALRALVESSGPVHHVDPSDSLFFIAHGVDDTVVSVAQSDQLAALLLEAGVPCDYYRVPDSGHEGTNFPWGGTIDFFIASFARPLLSSNFSFSPDQPDDDSPVKLTASASAGKPPYIHRWDVCGISVSGDSVDVTLPPGACEVILTTRDSAGAERVVKKDLNVASSIVISGIDWTPETKRLKIHGSGFEKECTITINGSEVPRSLFRSGDLLLAAGKGLRKMLPKGTEVEVRVVSPDGRSSFPFLFAR